MIKSIKSIFHTEFEENGIIRIKKNIEICKLVFRDGYLKFQYKNTLSIPIEDIEEISIENSKESTIWKTKENTGQKISIRYIKISFEKNEAFYSSEHIERIYDIISKYRNCRPIYLDKGKYFVFDSNSNKFNYLNNSTVEICKGPDGYYLRLFSKDKYPENNKISIERPSTDDKNISIRTRENTEYLTHWEKIEEDVHYYFDRNRIIWSVYYKELYYTFSMSMDIIETFKSRYIEAIYRSNIRDEDAENKGHLYYRKMTDSKVDVRSIEDKDLPREIVDSPVESIKGINLWVKDEKETFPRRKIEDPERKRQNIDSTKKDIDSNRYKDTELDSDEIDNILESDGDIIDRLATSDIEKKSVLENISNVSRAEKETAEKTSVDKNKDLIMGNENFYVTRGTSIGIFNKDVDFQAQIKNKISDPKKIIERDNRLTILEDDKLNILDLHRGDIINTLKTEKVNDIFDNGNIILLNDRSINLFDERSNRNEIMKEYKTKVDFQKGMMNNSYSTEPVKKSAATEKKGKAIHLNGKNIIVSKNGDIRIYKDLTKRASKLIPGFGGEVIGIDSVNDWILVTSKKYLLFYDGEIVKRLQLRPEHLHYFNRNYLLKEPESQHNGNTWSFIPGKFNSTGKFLITGIKDFVIRWEIKDIQNGRLFNYSIRKLGEKIVDESFLFDGTEILVALENDIKKVNKDDLYMI